MLRSPASLKKTLDLFLLQPPRWKIHRILCANCTTHWTSHLMCTLGEGRSAGRLVSDVTPGNWNVLEAGPYRYNRPEEVQDRSDTKVERDYIPQHPSLNNAAMFLHLPRSLCLSYWLAPSISLCPSIISYFLLVWTDHTTFISLLISLALPFKSLTCKIGQAQKTAPTGHTFLYALIVFKII